MTSSELIRMAAARFALVASLLVPSFAYLTKGMKDGL
jgi:hypothetical protein